MTTVDTARSIMQQCDILGSFSEETECLTRRFATSPMRRVNASVAAWMERAGMTTRQDAIGNIIGRYEGSRQDGGTLLLGSHLDTVRDAGKYDGPLGVLLAIACVHLLHERQQRLPFAIEVYGFADEEGLRYHTPYLGSQAVAGIFAPEYLQLTDKDGIPMAEAIRTFGGNPDALASCVRAKDELLGYCEVHIEQGPVLEARNLPLGVVSAIIGQNRFTVRFNGEAGHAGTVPMEMRRDALCAASEFITTVEQYARQQQGLVATVGQVAVHPNASNVIPGQTTLSLDIRHQNDEIREEANQHLERQARAIGQRRNVSVDWQAVQGHGTIACDAKLTELLGQAIEAQGYPVFSIPSGAGHDAAIMAHLTPIAMLFVRCRAGISHNPLESVTVEDVASALSVLERFVLLLAQEQG